MEFTAWFRQWLARHPLKEPTHREYASYTAEVMARIKTKLPSEAHVPVVVPHRLWWPWPHPAFVFAAAAAGITLVLITGQHLILRRQLAHAITRQVELLAAIGEPDGIGLEDNSVEGLVQQLEASDKLRLAEEPNSDTQWVQQTVELLDQLNDDSPDATNAPDTGWLDELETLDDGTRAASS